MIIKARSIFGRKVNMEEIKNDTLKNATAAELARAVAAILIEKKAVDVRVYELLEQSPITDYYVNVTGRSSTHVASLADELAYKTGLSGRDAARIEGKRGNSWILVDYGDVIVNVFDRESRDFYNLDRLMPENSEIDISEIVEQVNTKLDINNREV